MTIGTLIKITAQKKLMVKITEKTHDYIRDRLIAECKKKNFPTKLATFTIEDSHFMMISLDKYDKQNMRHFESLLKKEVTIQFRLKPYDFIPPGNDRVCGINLEMTSIRQIKPKTEEIEVEVRPVDDANELDNSVVNEEMPMDTPKLVRRRRRTAIEAQMSELEAAEAE